MPGARARVEPASPSEPSASDEASHLEVYLQKQLEEDIARIFDESLYSDIEVVCGKLTVLTHSCILKARTQKFYHNLNAILKVKIDRNIFEELYSFISDAYTECNIKQQEKEIIAFLDYNLKIDKLPVIEREHNKTEDKEPEVFLTPKCLSPYIEKALQKSLTTSPSTELTKEYYALVHIDHSLEKELIEQDVLSNAFQSIIKTQSDSNINKPKRNKPNSLPLTPSHISKPKKHSASCDKVNVEINLNSEKNLNHHCKAETLKNPDIKNQEAKKIISTETVVEKLDSIYSPDSLIADDPSSSSDYLSAAYNCSPGLASISWISHLNVGDTTKMENVFTSSDSGLETTGNLESLTSHKDVTLTDISLTESTLQDLTIDDAITSQDSGSFGETNQHQRLIKNASNSSSLSGTSSDKVLFNRSMANPHGRTQDQNGKSSKEEKQRQNEEIVILESSSLSSETGSWESVFPPKLPIKQSCESFLINERKFAKEDVRLKPSNPSHSTDEFGNILVEKSPFKTASCFIDASSLADEDDEILNVPINANETKTCEILENNAILAPSRPLPCSTAKVDFSPNDWSESNENDDSLEQGDKDPDSIQKDISPTIFEMTPMTEDSLCTNTFEKAIVSEELKALEPNENQSGLKSYALCNAYISNTPHNSIMSLKASSVKINESEESDDGSSVTNRENLCNIVKLKKYNESSPIVSGGASIEDYLPQVGSHSGSPMTRRKIENIPIVSGAYIPTVEIKNEEKKINKATSASAWVVDMSLSKSTVDKTICEKKPIDKAYEIVKNELRCSTSSENSKSRSSVDSDSSERSSQKFYIDLSSLPDMSSDKKSEIDSQSAANKKNIFSMYIDLGDKTKVKEMPPRLSSSLNSKKIITEKTSSKVALTNKSKEDVPITNTNQNAPTDITFEKYEALCNDTNLTISEIIAIPGKKTIPKSETAEKPSVEVNTQPFLRQTNSTTVIAEEPVDNTNEPFVKLSDLDKPIPKSDILLVETKERSLDARMTRSIPENNWGEQAQSNNSKSIEVISSFHSENALSLNRLFPHLKNEFSRSMPGSLSGRTKSPLRLVASSVGDVDEQTSSMSEISSVQSSMCRSILENSTTEETSQSSGRVVTGTCLSRLGQDLLRMFLEEIAPDVVVQVSGRRIKAHKCILSSRCQYFAGILSGGWVESAGNVILLPPFSYNVVHFALCHIYSGVSTIPDSISIVELATLADMLGLEGLKEAIMFTLKAKYCHHFHKPCTVCTAGVLECFPLSSVYGLDDLYRKCLIWITKYFFKVWPTKAFATLPKELLDKCYQQHIVNLTTDNLVDTVYGCGITVASLQNSRWAESVARMCQRLVNAAAHFAAPRLVGVLKAISAIPPTAPHSASQALNDCIAAAIEWAPPDETCRAYAFLSSLVAEMRNQNSKPDLISNGTDASHNSLLYVHASSWRLQCEGALVRAAPRNAFKELPHDLRKRLRALGCIMYGSQNPTPPPPVQVQDRKTRSSYHSRTKSQSSVTRSLDIDHVRATLINYAPKLATQATKAPTDKTSNNDLRKSRYKPPAVRTTKAQEERAKFNLTKNLPQERLTGTGKSSTARLNYLENAKPRYLEPRLKKEIDKKTPTKMLMNLVISSSESSRNSSPIHTRNLRTSGLRGRSDIAGHNMSQDSLATSSRPRTAEPSTESLSESQNSNKYATYTKVKHTKGSPECVKTKKGQAASPKSMPKSNNKPKTKIPVCVNQTTKPINTEARFSHAYNKNSQPQPNGQASNNRKSLERKLPGSLMMATKASQAKVVTKIVKESSVNKSPTKINKNKSKPKDVEPTPDIPVMERSGTFLKDEPTFGDKTLVDIQ